MPQQPRNLIDPAMADAPSSPREDRLAALLVMAETVVSKTDDEKADWNWKGRAEVVEAIALLASVTRTAKEQISDTVPTSSRPERDALEVKISPTIS